MANLSDNSQKRYTVLGVAIDPLTMSQASEQIARRSRQNGSVYVTKPYVEFLNRGRQNDKILALLNGSFLSLPDGVSTQWAVQYLYGGKRSLWRAFALAAQIVLRPRAVTALVPEKFGGANFTWALLEECVRQNLSVYLIGSPHQSSISKTAETICRQLLEIKIIGSWPGSLRDLAYSELDRAIDREEIEDELVADLKAKKPDIILVGMGFPLQEKIMAKVAPQLDRGVLIGEGGTFDYASFGGIRPRAPHWIQKLGLEWLWRLILEPRRLGRQLAIPAVMWAVYKQGRKC